ncbi:MAG: Serine/threonine protein phosphatase [uncultured Sulfurovum sp.]|uniref:Serine/threonine protein phosphatase n=1 Tax=uncultured Sulfurovum sp. TaxID=269237 RepID=A0A6S6SF71_9BACT|nr:MAG: Serine/threonine protein phosphatase [uncultured Sulfurovum sp.]
MNYCVVGDVHGEYKALINLVAKTPKGSQIIFVGDLVDRGSQSAHVIRFIRKHKLPCVQGNHEVMMINYGSKFIKDVKANRPIQQDNMWLKHGGLETLLSYGLVSIKNKEICLHPFIQEFIFQFEDDIEWMKKLPLYLELDAKHSSGRKVVVSHSAIAPVWKLKESREKKDMKKFNEMVLWGRVKPIDNEPIFNIFGHTPQRYVAETKRHYVNIDTGCYMKSEKGFGILSAYCVETEEVYSSSDLNYEKVS